MFHENRSDAWFYRNRLSGDLGDDANGGDAGIRKEAVRSRLAEAGAGHSLHCFLNSSPARREPLFRGIVSWITHQHFRDVGLQQIVQPGRAGALFKGDMQVSAQPVDEL